MAWHTLSPDHGVLEIHELLTGGVGLELQVVASRAGCLAWWVSDDGRVLGRVSVGRC